MSAVSVRREQPPHTVEFIKAWNHKSWRQQNVIFFHTEGTIGAAAHSTLVLIKWARTLFLFFLNVKGQLYLYAKSIKWSPSLVLNLCQAVAFLCKLYCGIVAALSCWSFNERETMETKVKATGKYNHQAAVPFASLVVAFLAYIHLLFVGEECFWHLFVVCISTWSCLTGAQTIMLKCVYQKEQFQLDRE